MASKKQIALIALAGLMTTASFSQTKNDASYGWVLDSSKRSTKKMPQQNEFTNNQYPYPSKPRSMWELGLSGSASFILGDVKQRVGYGGGISWRKALSHVFSMRLGWQGAWNYGLEDRLRAAKSIAGFGTPINPWRPYAQQGKEFMTSYKTAAHQLYADLLVSFNAISGYRGNPKVDWYLLAGFSYSSYDVDANALNGSNLYNFTPQFTHSDLDDSYESNALFSDSYKQNTTRLNDNELIYPGMDLGGGVSFKVSEKINIGLEEKLTLSFADELDGLATGRSTDSWSMTSLRMNINMGNASKKVAPLWWLNPNNYIYNEVNAPKHMKMPPVVLPDADGDGVTDQFDMEANTPAGAPVDSHGVSRDTDGDGVPDYKDKEPLTARDCFPVDADGVGKCPEPPCCAELRDSLKNWKPECSITSLPSVQFKSGSLTLSSTAKSALNSIAQQMNGNPNCNVRVNGYYSESNKRSQQLSWDRVNTVIKYLSEQQGISEGRLIFNLSSGGDPNTVDLMGTTETGPNTVPAPYPNLQKSK
jgi:OOP family OmpA-OmpF porin